MWRTSEQRAASAAQRLALAFSLWQWQPHPRQRELFTSPAQVTVAACGRRWGKTECLSVEIATLALDELAQGRDCRQLVVAPSDNQARLIGNEVLRLLLIAFEKDTEATAGMGFAVRQRPALTLTLTRTAPTPGPSPIGMREGKLGASGGEAKETVTASLIFHTAGRDGRACAGCGRTRSWWTKGRMCPTRCSTTS